jgi:hypothetical protein
VAGIAGDDAEGWILGKNFAGGQLTWADDAKNGDLREKSLR